MITTFQAMLIFVYVTIGVWYTFKTFDPKSIGGIIACTMFGAAFGTYVFAATALVKLLSIKVRK